MNVFFLCFCFRNDQDFSTFLVLLVIICLNSLPIHFDMLFLLVLTIKIYWCS